MQPYSPEATRASAADRAACRASIRAGSKSFFAASLLLPAAVREPALALYAFCRLADDVVDQGLVREPVENLRERLLLAYAGRPFAAAADRAFAAVVARYSIPRAVPEALLEGFQWDLEHRQYEDIHDLSEYAARVAGSVGAMMACLMGVRSPHGVARACDLGVAMQLTNIARDVGEDARAGRLYLPRTWLREAGIDPTDWLRRPEFSAGIATTVARLLAAADALYARADLGIELLPGACQPAIRAARALYCEIGHQLCRNGLDSVSRRTVVSTHRKLQILARGAIRAPSLAAMRADGAERAAPLEQTRFIVEALAVQPASEQPHAPARRGFEARLAWLVDLFERLERRDRQVG